MMGPTGWKWILTKHNTKAKKKLPCNKGGFVKSSRTSR